MKPSNPNTKIKILIVEDEVLVAKDLANRLSESYEVLSPVSSYDNALSALTNYDVDILIIDINLEGEKDGIELAAFLNDKHHLPFIFLSKLTNRQTIDRAKNANPSAYLVKPFNDWDISMAIELAIYNYATNKVVSDPGKEADKRTKDSQVMQIKDALFLKKDTYFEKVRLTDISLLEADNNYTTIYTKSNQYIYSTVLKKMEEKLPTDQFMRVHRSYVINIQAVSGFEGNTLIIHDRKIPVSKQYREAVFNLFKTI